MYTFSLKPPSKLKHKKYKTAVTFAEVDKSVFKITVQDIIYRNYAPGNWEILNLI